MTVLAPDHLLCAPEAVVAVTRVLDGNGQPLGEVEHGVEVPSVLASAPGGDTFVIGSDDELVAFQVARR